MNKKRSRNKIYHLIDTIFLLLPFIAIIFYISAVLLSLKAGNTLIFGFDFEYGDFSSFVSDYLFTSGSFDSFIELLIPSYDNSLFFGSFGLYLSDFLVNLGLDNNFWYFICYYFVYAICYEFLSLFVNIILWIPRFFRNRFQDVSEV